MKSKLAVLFCLLITHLLGATSPKHKILIGSPIRQKPAILKEFLASLSNLDQNCYEADYFFIDDNDEPESTALLDQFSKKRKVNCCLLKASKQSEQYVCNEEGHQWKTSLVWKVANFKDQIIEHALKHSYDYLFLIDSDIVLHPATVECLIDKNKDIISNIFWTAWSPQAMYLPQVWLKDHYTQYECEDGVKLSEQEIRNRHIQFLVKMRTPGTYEIGGLGACTLISKHALETGVHFKRLKNCSFWGEDRHFCLRAAALGLDLYVDTHHPAYHIFRESALSGVENFKHYCAYQAKKRGQGKPRITLSMIMKNEGNRRLKQVLEHAKQYITDAVIIDDGSTDNSVAICKKLLSNIPHKIIKNKASKFGNEIELRTQQWEETIKTHPDWIIILDADEILEDKFVEAIPSLVANPGVDAFYFRLYDLWDEEHYRSDPYWKGHESYIPFMIRYRPDVPQTWTKKTPQHCSRIPSSAYQFVGLATSYRIKHYGWSAPELREEKYERYSKLDPEAKYGVKEQYESILDPTPTLIKWEE